MANSHTIEQRIFIVRRLAAFEPSRSIVLDFVANFPDTRCDENDVKRNDPACGAVLPPDLFALFRATREAVLLDPESAPFADQKARLILLSNHVKFHNSNNELATARTVVRQIAEEMGLGANKAGGKPAAAGDKPEPVVEIVRRVVDPKSQVVA